MKRTELKRKSPLKAASGPKRSPMKRRAKKVAKADTIGEDSAMKLRSQKYRDAANGQPCTMNIMGVCNYDPATTVLAHLPGENNGTGTKVCDLNAVDACSECHGVIDGVAPWPGDEAKYKEWYFRRALHRTVFRRLSSGVLKI